MKVQIINKSNNPLPQYKTEGSVGMDICANIEKDIEIWSGQTIVIPTGLYISVPKGYEAQIRSRSGLASTEQIFVLNSPGTIDSDYRGEIKVILTSLMLENKEDGWKPFIIHNGDRIAQMVICPVEIVELVQVGELDCTNRGEGGFGSTGISDNAETPDEIDHTDYTEESGYDVPFESGFPDSQLENLYSYFNFDETTRK